jgi:hypothetical protein
MRSAGLAGLKQSRGQRAKQHQHVQAGSLVAAEPARQQQQHPDQCSQLAQARRHEPRRAPQACTQHRKAAAPLESSSSAQAAPVGARLLCPAAAATPRGPSLLQSVLQHSGMCDVPRQQGYMHKQLRARAPTSSSALPVAEAAAAQTTAAAAAVPGRVRGSRSCSRSRPAQQRGAASTVGISPESSGCSVHAVAGSCTGNMQQPLRTTQQPRQQQQRQRQQSPPARAALAASGSSPQLSGGSDRSHGLSLRRSGPARHRHVPSSPACAATAATSSTGSSAAAVRPRATMQQRPLSPRAGLVGSCSPPEPATRRLPVPAAGPAAAAAANAGAGGGGRTPAGTVAAAASLRAAVAGLGTREWQQQVHRGSVIVVVCCARARMQQQETHTHTVQQHTSSCALIYVPTHTIHTACHTRHRTSRRGCARCDWSCCQASRSRRCCQTPCATGCCWRASQQL